MEAFEIACHFSSLDEDGESPKGVLRDPVLHF